MKLVHTVGCNVEYLFPVTHLDFRGPPEVRQLGLTHSHLLLQTKSSFNPELGTKKPYGEGYSY